MNRSFIGDCRDVLRDLIAQGVRVQCVVTSPPYWGVRDYGIKPSVWGGDPECAHKWGDGVVLHRGGPHGDGVLLSGGRSVVDAQAATKKMRAGNFCESCGAWLGCLGLEPNIRMYIEHMVEVFRLVRDVLAKDGTLWLNIGDTYNTTNKSVGVKLKEMCAIPWRVGIALSDDGWYLRQDNIWNKPNAMPGSQRDRCTTAHEYVLLLSKSRKYYFDEDAIKEPASPNTHPRLARAHNGYEPPGQERHCGILAPRPNNNGINPKARTPSGWATGEHGHRELLGRYPKGPKDYRGVQIKGGDRVTGFNERWRVKQNASFAAATSGEIVGVRKKRTVWTIPTSPYPGPHYATFPPALVEPCILAGSRAGDTALDLFAGTGTVGEVCVRLARHYILIDIDPANEALQVERTNQPQTVMAV